eukprot:3989343-Alexandrium_andersonii.AAC.1
MRPVKGKGKGGKPSGILGGPGFPGGAKGAGKGGAFAGRCWKCNEVGHRSADRPQKAKNSSLQAVSEAGAAQPAPKPSTGDSAEWDFAVGLLE